MHQHHHHHQQQLHHHLNFAGLLLAWNIIAAVEQLLKLLLQSHVHVNWWREHLSCRKGETKLNSEQLQISVKFSFSKIPPPLLFASCCPLPIQYFKVFLIFRLIQNCCNLVFFSFRFLFHGPNIFIGQRSNHCLPLLKSVLQSVIFKYEMSAVFGHVKYRMSQKNVL